jgi:hypothetical protein
MTNKASKFKEGDAVQVLRGIKDPDFKIDISGWSGKIDEVEVAEKGGWLYKIMWDQKTLLQADNDYIDRCERNNLDFEIIYLEEKDLEIVENKDTATRGFFLA